MERPEGVPRSEPAVSYDADKIEKTAQKSYQGPVWIRWAIVSTLAFSLAAVTYGVIRPKSVSKGKPTGPVVTTKKSSSQSSISLTGLPLAIDAQFVLPASGGVSTHLAVAQNAIYFGTLDQSVNQWPTIHLSKALFSDSGKSLQDSLVQGETIELIPPIPTGLQQSAKAATYSVMQWHMSIMNDWVVATVLWTSKESTATEYQLYGLYLPTGRSAMFRTLNAPNNTVSFQIAAGDGKVVIAKVTTRPATNATKTGGTKKVKPSYPVEIDSIGGNNPLQAVTKSLETNVSIPVLDPVITNKLILFHTLPSTKYKITPLKWYTMNGEGKVQSFQPLANGQRSTAITVGKNGDAFVVSTVPMKSDPSQFTVRLTPLIQGSNKGTAASMALPEPASYVDASDGNLVWIQSSNGARVMVVARVN